MGLAQAQTQYVIIIIVIAGIIAYLLWQRNLNIKSASLGREKIRKKWRRIIYDSRFEDSPAWVMGQEKLGDKKFKLHLQSIVNPFKKASLEYLEGSLQLLNTLQSAASNSPVRLVWKGEKNETEVREFDQSRRAFAEVEQATVDKYREIGKVLDATERLLRAKREKEGTDRNT